MINSLRTMRAMLPLSLLFAGSVSYAQLPATPPAHIVILWEENYAYSDIIGSSYAPKINALANDPNAALFTGFCAESHPSQPNYLQMFSGSNQGITDDGYIPTEATGTYPYVTANLCAQLLGAGKTFKTYSEDLPAVGSDVYTYTTGGANYARKHNPCTNWVGTGTNQYSDTLNQPYTAFPTSTNYASLPTVSFVVPNMTNDMHDGTWPGNITLGDNWVYSNLDNLRAWTLDNNTLYIIIYDEDNDDTPNNSIPVIFYGPMVKHGTYSETINHYNLLRTIEDMYGLSYAGAASSATTITDCWRNVTNTTGVKNVANNNTFKVMPNPANDVINFNCSTTLSSNITITVLDASGQVAGKYTMSGSNLQVNTAAYAAGVYSYSIMADNGNKLTDGKFVVTHN